MNLVNQIKAQAKANKLMRDLAKLKEDAPQDYKWFGLAAATGRITTITDIAQFWKTVADIKKDYPEITNEDQLDEELCLWGDAVNTQFTQFLKKLPLAKMMEKLA